LLPQAVRCDVSGTNHTSQQWRCQCHLCCCQPSSHDQGGLTAPQQQQQQQQWWSDRSSSKGAAQHHGRQQRARCSTSASNIQTQEWCHTPQGVARCTTNHAFSTLPATQQRLPPSACPSGWTECLHLELVHTRALASNCTLADVTILTAHCNNRNHRLAQAARGALASTGSQKSRCLHTSPYN
jgi:hypothetical protein